MADVGTGPVAVTELSRHPFATNEAGVHFSGWAHRAIAHDSLRNVDILFVRLLLSADSPHSAASCCRHHKPSPQRLESIRRIADVKIRVILDTLEVGFGATALRPSCR
jgi:hypothetical protein